MKTARRLQVIVAVIGMITGISLIDGEPTRKEMLGGVILVIVVTIDLLVTAYRNEFREKEG